MTSPIIISENPEATSPSFTPMPDYGCHAPKESILALS
jgi:hypothetical protein